MRKIIAATALALAVSCTPGPAHAGQPRDTLLWAQIRGGEECQFSTLGPRRGGVLECQSGRVEKLRPLKTKDSARGYWLADYRGTKVGKSFVRFAGRTLYVSCWIDHPTRDTVREGACTDHVDGR